jgi:hypothetical protein
MQTSFSNLLLAKLWPSLPLCYHLYRLGIGVVFLATLQVLIFRKDSTAISDLSELRAHLRRILSMAR